MYTLVLHYYPNTTGMTDLKIPTIYTSLGTLL